MSIHWIKCKKLRETAKKPTAATEGSAGADLYACLEDGPVKIPAHQTVRIPTGIALELPEGFFGGLFARSGLAVKSGLRPANCVGVIDSDYRGEVIIALHNDADQDAEIENGMRIAQLVVMPCERVFYIEAQNLLDTDRGDGGFGSTGVM